MTLNPCGIFISAQGKDFNRTEAIRHVKAANYVTVTVLDDLQLAIDLNIPYAVFRRYGWEPQPVANTKESGYAKADIAFGDLVAWRQTHKGSENVLFMINCEQGFGVGVSHMYARLIERCATEVSPPIGLCIGNWASGAVKCGQAGEPNAWIDAGEPILRAMDKHKDKRLPNGSKAFVMGAHEYTSIHAWIASNGGEVQNKPRWEDRPRSIDWAKPQWHLGRMAQGVMAACKHFGIKDYPPVIITECLFDTMNDVIDRLGPLKLAEGYDKPRGWRSLVPQWKEWYAGRDPAAVLADMHIWTWETVYQPLGFVIGTHTYLYERTDDPNWISFQVDESDGKAYRDKMEAYRPGTTPVIVTLRADDLRWTPMVAQITVLSPGEIKAEPFVLNRTLDVLTLGVKHNVAYIAVDQMTDQEKVYSHDGNHRWYPIKMGTVVGWIRADWVTLTPPVIVDPPPPPKPAPDTTALPTEHVETLRAWLAGEIAKLEADAVEHQKIADAKRALANEKKALKAMLDMAVSAKVA